MVEGLHRAAIPPLAIIPSDGPDTPHSGNASKTVCLYHVMFARGKPQTPMTLTVKKQPVMPEQQTRVKAGALSGLLGGLAMSLCMLIAHFMTVGYTDTIPFTVMGTMASLPWEEWFDLYVIPGFLLHLGLTAGLGVLWCRCFGHKQRTAGAVLAGLVFGLHLYGVMLYGLAPWVDPLHAEIAQDTPLLYGYLLYGLSVACYSRK